jgi:hypothetical protein
MTAAQVNQLLALGVPQTFTVDYTDNIFKAASTAATKTLLTLAAGQLLLGVIIRPQTAFAGTAISACTGSIGSATGGNSDIYVSALDLMQTAGTAAQGGLFSGASMASPDSDLNVVITFAATGANFGNGSATVLTTGKVWITVITVTLPVGT